MVLEQTLLSINSYFARLQLCGLKCYAPDICCKLNISSQFETKRFRKFYAQCKGKTHSFAHVKQAVVWAVRLRKCGFTSTRALWLPTPTPCNHSSSPQAFCSAPPEKHQNTPCFVPRHVLMVWPASITHWQTDRKKFNHFSPFSGYLSLCRISILYPAAKFQTNCRNFIVFLSILFLSILVWN